MLIIMCLLFCFGFADFAIAAECFGVFSFNSVVLVLIT